MHLRIDPADRLTEKLKREKLLGLFSCGVLPGPSWPVFEGSSGGNRLYFKRTSQGSGP
jgi:hypothetical protein